MARPSAICFMPYIDEAQSAANIDTFYRGGVDHVVLLVTEKPKAKLRKSAKYILIDSLFSSKTMKAIAKYVGTSAKEILLYTGTAPIELKEGAVKRMLTRLHSKEYPFVYSHYYEQKGEELISHPVIKYQQGSYRNDFDFGALYLFEESTFREAAEIVPDYKYAGLYSIIQGTNVYSHELPSLIDDYLYTVKECDSRRSDEKQFDYVDPRNRDAQIEMEEVCTSALAFGMDSLKPGDYDDLSGIYEKHPVTGVSVIIPVRNRVRTIGDAIRSALFQECKLPFNILIVDNHSTDGTTEVIADCAARDPRIVHIIPEREDLGIGGCWNLAIRHKACKTIAVQLDSDDLYSDEKTLQKIVEVFIRKQCAMVIGSYRMTDFNLNTIAPGIIDHREWTERNGRNNGLRINGFGAPRAFYTPLVSKMSFPNTSYGEDYAMVLKITRRYPIERIYDVLYLCRRWEGNSDAALSIEKVNSNNLYKDKIRTLEVQERHKLNYQRLPSFVVFNGFCNQQLEHWPLAKKNHKALSQVEERRLENQIHLQFNPGRIASTKPVTDIRTTKTHSCILCKEQRPKEQSAFLNIGPFELFVNPFPIFQYHYTAIHEKHCNQNFFEAMESIAKGVESVPEYTFIYNGAQCGASVPDHAHFQLFKKVELPLFEQVEQGIAESTPLEFPSDFVKVYALNNYHYPVWVITEEPEMHRADLCRALRTVVRSLPVVKGEKEPRFNLLGWSNEDKSRRYAIIPRSKHRPDCFYAEGDEQFMVSPGAIDMGGYIITPRETDFQRLDAEKTKQILQEVAITPEQMQECIERWNKIMKL